MPNAGFGPEFAGLIVTMAFTGKPSLVALHRTQSDRTRAYLQQAGVYSRQATGRRYHERNARQSAEARATCHLGGWNRISAKPTAGPRPRKVDAAFRTDSGRPAKACRTEGHGQSEKFQGRCR